MIFASSFEIGLQSPSPGRWRCNTGLSSEVAAVWRTCSPLPRGDGAETLRSNSSIAPLPCFAVPFPGAMALKPVPHVLRTMHSKALAVPFPGAMALKRDGRDYFIRARIPCSPLPRGDGAETLRYAIIQAIIQSRRTLPRGDGAETTSSGQGKCP